MNEDDTIPLPPYGSDKCGHELIPLTDEQVWALGANLNPARIAQRSQGGAKLSYLEAWDVKASLTKVFGFGGFSAELLDYNTVMIQDDIPKSSGTGTNFRCTVSARLQLHIHQLGAWYTEAAAASQTGPDIGEVYDFALKTAESDALKRAAINLGTQFGLSLYNNGTTDDVINNIFAPDQKGGRDRHIAALRKAREAAAEEEDASRERGMKQGMEADPVAADDASKAAVGKIAESFKHEDAKA